MSAETSLRFLLLPEQNRPKVNSDADAMLISSVRYDEVKGDCCTKLVPLLSVIKYRKNYDTWTLWERKKIYQKEKAAQSDIHNYQPTE